MKDSKDLSTASTTSTKLDGQSERTGLPGVAHLALDAVDRGQSAALGIVHDVRGELRVVVDGGLDLAEKAVGSAFRVARKLAHRLDEAAIETIGNAERLIGGAVKSARQTTRSATEAAHHAIGGVTGATAQA